MYFDIVHHAACQYTNTVLNVCFRTHMWADQCSWWTPQIQTRAQEAAFSSPFSPLLPSSPSTGPGAPSPSPSPWTTRPPQHTSSLSTPRWAYTYKTIPVHFWHILNTLLFSQDQDKARPLSRLANLAITITDVQDMDPIFTNLPYSTNIEEDVPLVSITIPTNSTHPQLLFYPCSFYVNLSVSSSPILLYCQHIPLIFDLIAHPKLLLSHVHTPLWLFRRCLERVQEKRG